MRKQALSCQILKADTGYPVCKRNSKFTKRKGKSKRMKKKYHVVAHGSAGVPCYRRAPQGSPVGQAARGMQQALTEVTCGQMQMETPSRQMPPPTRPHGQYGIGFTIKPEQRRWDVGGGACGRTRPPRAPPWASHAHRHDYRCHFRVCGPEGRKQRLGAAAAFTVDVGSRVLDHEDRLSRWGR